MTSDEGAHSVAGLDLSALVPYFKAHLPDFGGELSVTLLAGGRSNLTFRLSDGTTDWVLRRPPLGPLTPSAHDMAREFRVVSGLARSGFPVPEAVLVAGEDGPLGLPFAVYSYVEGPVVRTDADAEALGPAAQPYVTALLTTLAELHEIPPDDAALGRLGRPDGYLGRQLDIWIAQWRRVTTSAWDGIDALHRDLVAALPPQSDARIVHGDFRWDNTIVAPTDPSQVRAVVDWEMATIGDPLADLGMLLGYWDPVVRPLLGGQHVPSANMRFGSSDDITEMYAQASGRDVSGIAFYRALALLKIAVIAEGIHQRFLAGMTVGAGFDLAGQTRALAIDRGRAVLAGVST